MKAKRPRQPRSKASRREAGKAARARTSGRPKKNWRAGPPRPRPQPYYRRSDVPTSDAHSRIFRSEMLLVDADTRRREREEAELRAREDAEAKRKEEELEANLNKSKV